MSLLRIFFTVVLLLSTSSFAQSIKVYDGDDNEPIAFAHIIVTDIDGSNKQIFLTDSLGKVKLKNFGTNPDKKIIQISCIGYAKVTDTIVGTFTEKIYPLETENFTLNEMVITAQYEPGSTENSIHRVKVIDKKKIEAMAAQNLRDVLTNETNIRLSQDNILGSSLSMQGVSGQNVKILIDGVPVIGRLNNNIDLSQLNLNDVERIEIVEGPLAVNYGTDALAGAINIITKKGSSKKTTFNATTYYESSGNYNLLLNSSFPIKKSTIAISAGRNFFDGWNSTDKPFKIEKKTAADSTRFQSWKPKEQYFGNVKFSRSIFKLQTSFTSRIFYEKIQNRGEPRLPYYETAFDDYYYTTRFDNSINSTGKLSDNFYLNFIVAYNYYERIKNTYYKDLTTLEEILTETEGDQDTSNYTALMSRASINFVRDTSIINFQLGYDINIENAKARRISGDGQQIGDYALFTSLEYKPLENLKIRPGLRISYNTAYNSPLIPSLNLMYKIPISDKNGNSFLSIRGSYAKGFRSPSLKELHFNFVDINHDITGNTDLNAEHSDNFSIAASYQFAKNQTVMKLEAYGFYNDIRNLITLAQFGSSTEYSYINIGKYKTTGLNLNTEFLVKHLKFSFGFSYIGRYNELSEEYTVDEFSFSPEFRSSFSYDFRKIGLSVALFYKYNGKLPSYVLETEDAVSQYFIDAYHMADISVNKQLFNKKLTVGIGSKNLFDVTNINGTASSSAHSSASSSLPIAVGRTYFCRLNFKL